jgi:hypothetical protein
MQAVSGGKGCLWNVFCANLDLMIAQSEIDLGKDLGTGQLIKEHIIAG